MFGRRAKALRHADTNHSGRKHFEDTLQPAGLEFPSPNGPWDKMYARLVGRFFGKLVAVAPKSIAEVPPAVACPPGQSVMSR